MASSRVHTDSFVERGGLAALYGEGGSVDATFSTLGLRARTQAGDTTRLRDMLGWRHAFGDTMPTSTHAFAGSIPFTLEGLHLVHPCLRVPLLHDETLEQSGAAKAARFRPVFAFLRPS
ncbi:autotransporter domain-containing protein [Variovorax paradoxus]|nr:autotransporter domain-containing protein [Variovorax paradoxus]MBT2300990.1 autotransporter domain-containing protein [Variovorax paradoxus]